jgi:hypothetical protein
MLSNSEFHLYSTLVAIFLAWMLRILFSFKLRALCCCFVLYGYGCIKLRSFPFLQQTSLLLLFEVEFHYIALTVLELVPSISAE